jgi:hypothetical protein
VASTALKHFREWGRCRACWRAVGQRLVQGFVFFMTSSRLECEVTIAINPSTQSTVAKISFRRLKSDFGIQAVSGLTKTANQRGMHSPASRDNRNPGTRMRDQVNEGPGPNRG